MEVREKAEFLAQIASEYAEMVNRVNVAEANAKRALDASSEAWRLVHQENIILFEQAARWREFATRCSRMLRDLGFLFFDDNPCPDGFGTIVRRTDDGVVVTTNYNPEPLGSLVMPEWYELQRDEVVRMLMEREEQLETVRNQAAWESSEGDWEMQ